MIQFDETKVWMTVSNLTVAICLHEAILTYGLCPIRIPLLLPVKSDAQEKFLTKFVKITEPVSRISTHN